MKTVSLLLLSLFMRNTSFAQNITGTYLNGAGQELIITNEEECCFDFEVTWGVDDEWGCLFYDVGTATFSGPASAYYGDDPEASAIDFSINGNTVTITGGYDYIGSDCARYGESSEETYTKFVKSSDGEYDGGYDESEGEDDGESEGGYFGEYYGEYDEIYIEELAYLVGTWQGTIGDDAITIVIEHVEGPFVTGYNIVGGNRRPISGRLEDSGYAVVCATACDGALHEPGDHKWDGSFELQFEGVYQYYDETEEGPACWGDYVGSTASGTWKANDSSLGEKEVYLEFVN